MRARLTTAAVAALGVASFSYAAIPIAGPGGNGGLPGGGAETANYSIDDGTAENSVGFGPTSTTANDLLWLNTFPTASGGELITSISIAYGSPSFPTSATNGTPVRVLLYNDPDGGSPQNGTLLVDFPGVVSGANTNAFATYDIPDTAVGANFAIGVLMPNTLGATNPYPAALDQTTPTLSARSYLGYAAGGTINPANLAGIPSGQFNTEEAIIPTAPGNWLIRAVGEPVPEPASLGALGIGAAALVVRRRRA